MQENKAWDVGKIVGNHRIVGRFVSNTKAIDGELLVLLQTGPNNMMSDFIVTAGVSGIPKSMLYEHAEDRIKEAVEWCKFFSVKRSVVCTLFDLSLAKSYKTHKRKQLVRKARIVK